MDISAVSNAQSNEQVKKAPPPKVERDEEKLEARKDDEKQEVARRETRNPESSFQATA